MASYWVEIFVDWMSLPSLGLLAVIFLYKKYHREFPLFFAYIIAVDVIGVVRLFASRVGGRVYYNTYYISDIAIAAFAFMATYELFIKRLFPAFYKINFFRYLFPISAILITLLGASTALYRGELPVLLAGVRVYEFLRAATVLFFTVLMVFMGRHWTKQEFGIAFGFGLDVSASFATLALMSRNAHPGVFIRSIPVFAYDIACVVWLYCFWSAPAAKDASPPSLPTDALHEAKKWETSLKDYIASGKR